MPVAKAIVEGANVEPPNKEEPNAGVYHDVMLEAPLSSQIRRKKRHPRMTYAQSFKWMVVQYSLQFHPTRRFKHTCRVFPGIEKAQLRKWIRQHLAQMDTQMDSPSSNP